MQRQIREDPVTCTRFARGLCQLVGPGLWALALLVMLVGCQTDEQRIRTTNQALATLAADGIQLSAEIQSVDSKEGDCINSTLPEDISVETVEIVLCAGEWQYRVLNTFELADGDRYPGERHVIDMAAKKCDRRHTYVLHPESESWDLGERTIDCLQESFGLSVANLDKLDRLINPHLLDVGECFNEAPETEGYLVELVGCSGEWEFRVLDTFEVHESGVYPGDDYFGGQSHEKCDKPYSYTQYPLAETWNQGDRTVSCLQVSYGLSVSDPDRLDRLVTVGSLSPGECFNEAPETDHVLVEEVDCAGNWELQVTRVFELSAQGEFPGGGYLDSEAATHCGPAQGLYYEPSAETWRWGDRTVVCAVEGEAETLP